VSPSPWTAIRRHSGTAGNRLSCRPQRAPRCARSCPPGSDRSVCDLDPSENGADAVFSLAIMYSG